MAEPTVKREGDGKTPLGRWPMREILFRADRLPLPVTSLPVRVLNPRDGWCENPDDPAYNKPVRLPYRVAVDAMWRDDHLYDLIVVLGYNDAPVRAGAGSAIFMHIARPDYAPTAGCVALRQEDLLAVLREADAGSCVVVK